jgi:hypothetical protein
MTEAIPRPPEGWLSLVRAARARCDYLAAIDLAGQGLERHPGDMDLHYERLLAYARAGATENALAGVRKLAAEGAFDTIAEPKLFIDLISLEPRLLKDQAFACDPPEPAALRRAAQAYAAVHARTEASFPAVNAATLHCLAGDRELAARLAAAALAQARREPADYWQAVTIAEAQLVLGQPAAARAALQDAVATGPHPDQIATTRRQLRLLCRGLGSGAEALDVLPVPYLLHWPPISARPDGADLLASVRSLARACADQGRLLIAYGAICGLDDIGVAEALADAGAELHLAIPCAAQVHAQALAGRSGPDWAARFLSVVGRAAGVTEVTLEGDSAEPTVARMAGQQALGLARMRSAALIAPLHHLHDWSEVPSDDERIAREGGRVPRAFVFADVKDYGKLSEAAHRPFLDHVIGGFADALAALGSAVEYVETSGDGVFAILHDVISALRCCYGLRRVMDPVKFAQVGLPPALGLRMAAHAGPAARGLDRVTGREKFIGKEVIRAARLEPVTPVGQIYVTEQFAAILHATSSVGHACEYVGMQKMAKDCGYCRMYSLRTTPEIAGLLR